MFRGDTGLNFKIMSVKIVFILANSAYPDDPNTAFHLGLHCLPRSTGIQNEKGQSGLYIDKSV